MRPEHIFELCSFLLLAGIAIGYGFRGLWNRILKKLRTPIYSHLVDVHAGIQSVLNDAETDWTKIKPKLQSVLTRIEKVLPL